ncbi:initiation factor 2, partial [Aureobasidium melanogenum]
MTRSLIFIGVNSCFAGCCGLDIGTCCSGCFLSGLFGSRSFLGQVTLNLLFAALGIDLFHVFSHADAFSLFVAESDYIGSLLFVRCLDDFVACVGLVAPTVDFDGCTRTSRHLAYSCLIAETADTSPGLACHDDGTRLQCTAADKHSSYTATGLGSGFDDPTLDLTLGSSTVVQDLRKSDCCIFELINALTSLATDRHDLGLTTEVFDFNTMASQVLLDTLDVGFFLVDLVDGNDDRYMSRLSVLDGFNGLRLDRIVSCDNQNDNVGHSGTTLAHLKESCMSRCIEEGDEAAIDDLRRRSDRQEFFVLGCRLWQCLQVTLLSLSLFLSTESRVKVVLHSNQTCLFSTKNVIVRYADEFCLLCCLFLLCLAGFLAFITVVAHSAKVTFDIVIIVKSAAAASTRFVIVLFVYFVEPAAASFGGLRLARIGFSFVVFLNEARRSASIALCQFSGCFRLSRVQLFSFSRGLFRCRDSICSSHVSSSASRFSGLSQAWSGPDAEVWELRWMKLFGCLHYHFPAPAVSIAAAGVAISKYSKARSTRTIFLRPFGLFLLDAHLRFVNECTSFHQPPPITTM